MGYKGMWGTGMQGRSGVLAGMTTALGSVLWLSTMSHHDFPLLPAWLYPWLSVLCISRWAPHLWEVFSSSVSSTRPCVPRVPQQSCPLHRGSPLFLGAADLNYCVHTVSIHTQSIWQTEGSS